MKEISIIFIVLLTIYNGYAQTCTFTGSGVWDKNPTATVSCTSGTPSGASLIIIKAGIEVTINDAVTWGANVEVNGTINIQKPLIRL